MVFLEVILKIVKTLFVYSNLNLSNTHIFMYVQLKDKEFPQLPRHFRKCLGISGNAWFLQFPATYIYPSPPKKIVRHLTYFYAYWWLQTLKLTLPYPLLICWVKSCNSLCGGSLTAVNVIWYLQVALVICRLCICEFAYSRLGKIHQASFFANNCIQLLRLCAILANFKRESQVFKIWFWI